MGTLALHLLGATLSAGALGAVLGGAGMVLGAPWGVAGALAVAGVTALYGARELAGLPVPLPELRRQVPEWWRSAFSPGTAGFLYGLGLGVGFAT
ncbi:MAG: methylamine utilization protein MauF, partial [Actinomycetota bacterium]